MWTYGSVRRGSLYYFGVLMCPDVCVCAPSPQHRLHARDHGLRRPGPPALPAEGEEPGHGRLHAQPTSAHLGVAQLPPVSTDHGPRWSSAPRGRRRRPSDTTHTHTHTHTHTEGSSLHLSAPQTPHTHTHTARVHLYVTSCDGTEITQ